MTDVNDPVRRLLERIDHAGTPVGWPSGVITPDVARTWLALPEQLQQARDAMRWRKASQVREDGKYAFTIDDRSDIEIVTVVSGKAVSEDVCTSDHVPVSLHTVFVVYETGGHDPIAEMPRSARFLGPLPEVPR